MLEYVVRPFQSPGVHGTVIIPSTPSGSRERATLSWSADATLPATAFSGFDEKCCREDGLETKRDTEQVRILGNDGESYIDVERSQKLYIDKSTDKSGCYDLGQTGFSVAGDFLPSDDFVTDAGAKSTKEECKLTLSLNNNTTQG